MKKVLTGSNAQSPVSMPITRDSIDYMQLGSAHSISRLLINLFPFLTPGTIYILQGCINTGTNPTVTISSGSVVMWNATNNLYEVYAVPAFSGTLSGGQSIIANQVDVLAPGGQVLLSNGTLASTNVDSQIQISLSSSAGGVPAFSTWVQVAHVPKNGIIMYSGSVSAIPTGWLLCDGTSGTPNLKGRFIVGYDPGDADYSTIGNNGGAKAITLTAAQSGLPAHTHNGIPAVSLPNQGSQASNGDLISGATVTGPVTGGAQPASQSHENRPPYYTLAYIMKAY